MLTIGRFCLIASIIASDAAWCGPPFTTDDPGVVETGRVELLPFYQATLAAQGRFGTILGLESHFGIAKNAELDVTTPWALAKTSGGRTQRGYGDTSLGIKYELLDETDNRPLVTLVPKFNFPTGDSARGLGNGGSQIFLGAAAQKNVGAFQTYATVGYWLNHGSDNRNYAFAGAVIEREFASRWTLGAELFANGATAAMQPVSVGFNAGGRYKLDENGHVLFSAGRGLVHARDTNRVSTYLGYQRSLR